METYGDGKPVGNGNLVKPSNPTPLPSVAPVPTKVEKKSDYVQVKTDKQYISFSF